MNELTPTADQLALAHVVLDIEKAASLVGWDHAPSLYALVRTVTLLDQPDLPEEPRTCHCSPRGGSTGSGRSR